MKGIMIGFRRVRAHPSEGAKKTPRSLFSIILDQDKVRYQQHFTVKCNWSQKYNRLKNMGLFQIHKVILAKIDYTHKKASDLCTLQQ